MNTHQLAQLIDSARLPGVRTFPGVYRSSAAEEAQACLSGRSHYYDPPTLRFFRSRVLSSEVICNGLLHVGVETLSADSQHTRRVYRYVAHDIFGTVVYNSDLGAARRTREPARKDFDTWLAGFDVAAHTLAAIREHAAATQAAAAALAAFINSI